MIAKFHVAKERYIFGNEGSSFYNRIYGSVQAYNYTLICYIRIIILLIRNALAVAQHILNPPGVSTWFVVMCNSIIAYSNDMNSIQNREPIVRMEKFVYFNGFSYIAKISCVCKLPLLCVTCSISSYSTLAVC